MTYTDYGEKRKDNGKGMFDKLDDLVKQYNYTESTWRNGGEQIYDMKVSVVASRLQVNIRSF